MPHIPQDNLEVSRVVRVSDDNIQYRVVHNDCHWPIVGIYARNRQIDHFSRYCHDDVVTNLRKDAWRH